jgi:DNA-binding transcriptional LysR family regulator
MPQPILEFRKLHPLVELQMNDAINYETVKDWFSKDVIDCAFTAEAGKVHANEIPLVRDPYYVILPHDHPLAKYKKITPLLLKGETFVIPSEGTSYSVGQILRQAKGKLIEHNGFLSDQATIAMVRGGCGVSILPKLVLDSYSYSGYLRRILDPEAYRIIYLCLPSRKMLRPSTRAFITFATAWVKTHAENVILE